MFTVLRSADGVYLCMGHRHYFLIQHKLTGFYNVEVGRLLRSMNCVFICISGLSRSERVNPVLCTNSWVRFTNVWF